MKTIKVKVKRKHIKKGNQGEGGSCPIYWAMHDMGFRKHHVSGDCGIYLSKNAFRDSHGDIRTPKKANKFITDFDAGKPVSPLEFNIRVPNKLVPLPLLLPK